MTRSVAGKYSGKYKIGIASHAEQKKRIMAIARGDHVPGQGEPKVWFTSVEQAAQVLSSKNIELIKIIHEAQPSSVSELAELSGRKQGNLSRTLQLLKRYNLIDLETIGRQKKPVAHAARFVMEFSIDA